MRQNIWRRDTPKWLIAAFIVGAIVVNVCFWTMQTGAFWNEVLIVAAGVVVFLILNSMSSCLKVQDGDEPDAGERGDD